MNAQPTELAVSTDPERWVEAYGDFLYRCALLRLRDPKLAEDVVQETLLSALESRDRFAGHSSERGWLVGILKHKVFDYFRKMSREAPVQDADALAADPNEALFDDHGHWKTDETSPVEWVEDAGMSLERKEFWDTMERCLSKLPPRTAHAFSLREIDDLSGNQVCEILNISNANLWVMLHRARAGLRRCLEIHWFGKRSPGK